MDELTYFTSLSIPIRLPLCAAFKPQPDITAYELALILPYLQGRSLYQEDLDQLGAAARHLEKSNG